MEVVVGLVEEVEVDGEMVRILIDNIRKFGQGGRGIPEGLPSVIEKQTPPFWVFSQILGISIEILMLNFNKKGIQDTIWLTD